MIRSWRVIIAVFALSLVALPSCARAHVIPNDARFHAFLKPEGQRLRLLVRAPLEAMVDLTYPTRGTTDLLDLERADRVLRELAALWIGNNIEVDEAGRTLPAGRVVEVRASLPLDGSFATYDLALQHVTGPPLTNAVDFVWNQGLLDILLEYPIESPRSQFAVHSRLSTLAVRTTTSLTFVAPDGHVRAAFDYAGDPGFIALEPAWYHTVARFVSTGVAEILAGSEYWLYLFVLAVPLARWPTLVPVVAAFALAEAITLNPSSSFAPDALWFQPLIGVVLAAAIVYMAIENGISAGAAHRWMLAFVFGLALGFRFSIAVRDSLQFAGTHQWASLAAFAVGADLAQSALLVLFVPTLRLLFSLATERVARFVLSLMAGDIAWHWMATRLTMLRQYQFQWPALTPALALTAVNWAINLLIAGAAFWLLLTAVRRFPSGTSPLDPSTADVKS